MQKMHFFLWKGNKLTFYDDSGINVQCGYRAGHGSNEYADVSHVNKEFFEKHLPMSSRRDFCTKVNSASLMNLPSQISRLGHLRLIRIGIMNDRFTFLKMWSKFWEKILIWNQRWLFAHTGISFIHQRRECLNMYFIPLPMKENF